jgi:septal ring factor EnvC (AmiA/AmiB activator)
MLLRFSRRSVLLTYSLFEANEMTRKENEMKTIAKAVVIASLTLLVASPSFAYHGDRGYGKSDRIVDRIERQQRRIERGIDNDDLTRKEARQLRRNLKDIRQLKRIFRDDGRLSKRERRYLHNRLDKSSRQIKRLKHNEIRRYVRLHDRYGKGSLAQEF